MKIFIAISAALGHTTTPTNKNMDKGMKKHGHVKILLPAFSTIV